MRIHIKSSRLLATRHINLILLAAILLGATLLGACAQSPEDIVPAYISQSRFKGWSCELLVQEKSHLAAALITSSAQQQQARDSDIAGIILLGLPVGSLSGGNVAAQIARLKGERNAVERALAVNECTGAVAANAAMSPSAPAAARETAALEPEAPACGPLTVDDASRPELKAALRRYYKRHPLQRNHYGSPRGLQSIETVTVADISGNLMTLKVRYRASKVHFGVAKVEACGSNFRVLSFS